jgi:hypothetical protein
MLMKTREANVEGEARLINNIADTRNTRSQKISKYLSYKS